MNVAETVSMSLLHSLELVVIERIILNHFHRLVDCASVYYIVPIAEYSNARMISNESVNTSVLSFLNVGCCVKGQSHSCERATVPTLTQWLRAIELPFT